MHLTTLGLPGLYTGTGAERYHAMTLQDDTEIPGILELLDQLTEPRLAHLRVLELACGSGRITLPMAQAGHRVLATDLSADMLAILSDRLSTDALQAVAGQVELRLADMTTFAADEKFKAVCLATASITLLDPDQQHRTLENAVSHLAAGGILIVSTDFITVKERTINTVTLAPGVTLTEDVDPAGGRRRTTLTWGEESYESHLHLVPPAHLNAELARLGLRTVFQQSVASPSLPHHSNVLIGAVLRHG